MAGADDRLAFRAARELDRRPALAVLVAPAASSDATVAAVVTKVCAMLRNRGQEAVVSGPLPAGTTARPGVTRSWTAAADRLPVSWPPATGTGIAPAGAGRRALAAAAGANVQTLVRACWPGTLAPDLSSTRLGFAFVAARHTGVGVVGASDIATARVLARLRVWGFPGASSRARGRRMAAAADGPGGLLPAGRAGMPRWRSPATLGCRREVSSRLTTVPATS